VLKFLISIHRRKSSKQKTAAGIASQKFRGTTIGGAPEMHAG